MAEDIFNNPFQVNRAEHLGEELYQYFAGAHLLSGLLSKRSLVIQGGRGSGKTMYLMYNSYESKKRQHYDVADNRSHILDQEKILAVYFKAEPDLVTGFRMKGHDDDWWLEVFGHYLNVRMCRCLAKIASDLKLNKLALFPNEKSISYKTAKNFGGLVGNISTFENLCELLEEAEDEILLFINNIDKIPQPILSNRSHATRLLAKLLISDIGIKDLSFHVFIDEYENLEDYQQRLVNSFVKNPNPELVFDLGVRKKGFKTHNTLVSTEQISPGNDFLLFDLEDEIGAKHFHPLLKEICSKRLSKVPSLSNLPQNDKRLDIEYYLGKYDIKKEVELIIQKEPKHPYIKELEVQLNKIKNESERLKIMKALTSDSDPIINRLNLVLLFQKNNVNDILVELDKYKRGEESKYSEWLHNYGPGVVFLLCRDYRQRKRYFGCDAFSQLSSGIPRYFIQLCFYAFEFAHRDEGFDFEEHSKHLSVTVQSKAAYHVSANKVDEIDTYPPLGHRLKRLILILGRIFEQLHKKPGISEPEQNHFYVNVDSLSESSREVLNSGLMWAVFQARPLTKIKSTSQPRGNEYHLNHIYAPYFDISYRKKKRLDISSDDFDKLVNGESATVTTVASRLIGSSDLRSLADLLQWEDMQPTQMDLWSQDDNQQDL